MLTKLQHPCDNSRYLRFAVTGGRHIGKTSALWEIFQSSRNFGLDVAGFIEKALFEHENRIGYDFFDLLTQETCPVARKNGDHGYAFDEAAWEWVKIRLKTSETHPILIVDELGRLEAQNQGMMPSLIESLQNHPRHLITSVRQDAIHQIESLVGSFDRVICL